MDITSPVASPVSGPQQKAGRGLDPQPMVDWLAPGELARSGVKAVLAAVFGAYADHREMQAALDPLDRRPSLFDADYSAEPELWLDYVADLADGFNPTYAVAWLLSRDGLKVDGETLPRGRLLVLGGDQVYPTASRKEYWRRFHAPYRTALPGPAGPDLFAIPGNHDWYDGLANFLRLFCQKRRLGGWQTRQARSYFAVKLPHHWHLWGIDQQLGAYIDRPQLRFFEAVAERIAEDARTAGATPRLILCTPEPTWVYCGVAGPEGDAVTSRDALPRTPSSFANLAFFEDQVVRRRGIRLATVLSGDLHHYVRYEREDAGGSSSQRVTCGGGGAYLYPTHHMPGAIEVEEQAPARYRRAAAYPRPERSRRMARGCWFLPFRNRSFSFGLGALYLFFAWLLQSASKSLHGAGSLLEDLAGHPLREAGAALGDFWHVARHSPASILYALLVVGLVHAFRTSGNRYEGPEARRRRLRDHVWGAGHGLAHLGLALGLIWAAAGVNLRLLGLEVDDTLQFLLFSGEMLVGGGLLGALVFATYLMLSARWTDAHHNEVFASQRIQDHKHFLRLHIGPDGGLTGHAVGVPQVPRRWTSAPGGGLEPPAGGIAVESVDRFHAG